MKNRQVQLARRPNGTPVPDDFRSVDVDMPDLDEGQARVKVSHLSIDAFIRTALDTGSFHDTVTMDTPVVALGVGEVIDSLDPSLKKGDWVTGPMMAQVFAQGPAQMFNKIDVSGNLPPQAYLGALGVTTGLTAYFGILRVAEVKKGDTVVVSAAAGAVGSVVCQIAKLHGARVVGIAGGPDKTAFLTGELGLDAAVDYKGGDVGEQLSAACPDGIDVFFDNVGGDVLDLVLDRINPGARVTICGAISQYDHMDDVQGPKLYLRLAERNSSMRGFTVFNFQSEYADAVKDLGRWLQEGSLTMPETVVDGLDNFATALDSLFNGANVGKMLVKV